MELPPVYPITDVRTSGLSHLEQVKRLVEGGATLIQLREKRATPREFYSQAIECIAYARPRGVRIIINDRADIARATGADGVHLGQDDMPPEAARELLGPEAIVGYSTHTVEQAAAAGRLPLDYIAIGPVFATRTKSRPDATVGLGGIEAVRSVVRDLPVVAIGGIDASNLGSVLIARADSAAVISGILWDPERVTISMREMLELASV